MVSAALFPILSKKFSRKTVFGGCLVFMLCGIGVFAIAGNNLALVLLAAVMFAFPQQMVFLVVLMIITDSVEYGQWKLGHRDESLSLSIRPLIDKFGGAVSNGVVGQIAILAGMTTGATASSITAAGRMNFKMMMFAVPAVMLMISIIIFMKKITLTEERHAQIVAELEKTWGKDLGISVKNTSSDEKVSVKAPVSGNLIELSEVNDDVFSKGQAGLGFAGRVYAPFDATVRQVFSTRHAVGIVADNGMALLIHVGLGTVALKGTGFVTYVEEGQRISQGDEILEFWDDTIRKAGLDDTVIVTVTNSDKFEDFTLKQKSGAEIKAMDDAMELRVKKG